MVSLQKALGMTRRTDPIPKTRNRSQSRLQLSSRDRPFVALAARNSFFAVADTSSDSYLDAPDSNCGACSPMPRLPYRGRLNRGPGLSLRKAPPLNAPTPLCDADLRSDVELFRQKSCMLPLHAQDLVQLPARLLP